MLSSRGLCVGLITRPEESYRLWCVIVCDLESSRKRRPWPSGGCRAKNKLTNKQHIYIKLYKSLIFKVGWKLILRRLLTQKDTLFLPTRFVNVYRVVIAINHSLQRPEFIDSSVNVRFVLDAVALGQVFLPDSLASVIKQMLSTLICILTLMFSERKTRET